MATATLFLAFRTTARLLEGTQLSQGAAQASISTKLMGSPNGCGPLVKTHKCNTAHWQRSSRWLAEDPCLQMETLLTGDSHQCPYELASYTPLSMPSQRGGMEARLLTMSWLLFSRRLLLNGSRVCLSKGCLFGQLVFVILFPS